RVRELYYEIAYLDRATATLRDTRELLRGFREVSESLYAVGDGLQADVLQAQIAVAETTGDLTLFEERRTATLARLNALLGRGPQEDLGAVELPPTGGPLPPTEELMARAAVARPALAAARERIRAAEAARRGADLNAKPDISLMAAYGHRSGFADLASISVGVSLPLFSGSKQQPMRRESEAVLRLREAQELELLNETFARLTELRAAADRALELERLYGTSILPQARAAVAAALSEYQVGRVDFMTLLNMQMTVNRFEIERLRLSADNHIAVAGIEAFLDGRLEETAP
ncbi:MAG: TolC family protein, partial [Gemmatimonadota bacterium]